MAASMSSYEFGSEFHFIQFDINVWASPDNTWEGNFEAAKQTRLLSSSLQDDSYTKVFALYFD